MMYCKCDGCGKESPAIYTGKEYLKPTGWFERRTMAEDHERVPNHSPLVLQICSLECAEKATENHRKEVEKERALIRVAVAIKHDMQENLQNGS